MQCIFNFKSRSRGIHRLIEKKTATQQEQNSKQQMEYEEFQVHCVSSGGIKAAQVDRLNRALCSWQRVTLVKRTEQKPILSNESTLRRRLGYLMTHKFTACRTFDCICSADDSFSFKQNS